MNNKTKYLLLLFCLYNLISYSQSDTTIFKLFNGQNINKYYDFDNQIFYTDNNNSLYFRNQRIDCNTKNNPVNFVYSGKEIYFEVPEEPFVNIYSIKNGICKLKYKVQNSNILNQFTYTTNKENKNIIYDIENNSVIKKYEFETNNRLLFNAYSPSPKTYVFSYAYDEGGGSDFNFYICKEKKEIFIESTFRKYKNFFFEILRFNKKTGFYHVNISYDNKRGFNENASQVWDNDLNFVGNILKIANTHIGYKLLGDSIISYYYKQTLNKKSFIYEYKFNPVLELAMNKAHQDSLVLDAYYPKMGIQELLILKNLVYAKHNKSFDSQYLNVFFNSFEFYQNKTKVNNRLANVDNLITPTDKINLANIENQIKTRFPKWVGYRIP